MTNDGTDKLANMLLEVDEVSSSPILDCKEVATYPVLRNASKRDQMIISLRALGFGVTAMAKHLKIKQRTVRDAILNLDPDGKFAIDQKGRRAIIARLAEARCTGALLSIDEDGIDELNALEKIRFAKLANDISSKASGETNAKEKKVTSLDSLVGSIQAEEASFEMVDDVNAEEYAEDEDISRGLLSE